MELIKDTDKLFYPESDLGNYREWHPGTKGLEFLVGRVCAVAERKFHYDSELANLSQPLRDKIWCLYLSYSGVGPENYKRIHKLTDEEFSLLMPGLQISEFQNESFHVVQDLPMRSIDYILAEESKCLDRMYSSFSLNKGHLVNKPLVLYHFWERYAHAKGMLEAATKRENPEEDPRYWRAQKRGALFSALSFMVRNPVGLLLSAVPYWQLRRKALKYEEACEERRKEVMDELLQPKNLSN